jgi:hypothetical protein
VWPLRTILGPARSSVQESLRNRRMTCT